MNIFETIGFAWVVLGAGCFTAAAMICAGVGAHHIWQTYKEGVEQREFEKITRP